MTLAQKAPKKIYIRVEYVPRTFTISWEEKSNMSSGWTYSDDAAGLTAGDTAFDEFFGYSAVRLSSSGVETAEVTQEDSGGYGKLDITRLGDLTSGDNVMIKFPVRGIKMTKSGSVVTLSITEELGKSGYQYYAHSLGTLDNPGTPKDNFYLGAYEGYVASSLMSSLSGKSPTNGLTGYNYSTYARNNGTGYNIMGFYQKMYITALYMMKYGNPNAQNTIGKGYTGGSSKVNTGGTNNQTNATYGTTSNTTQCKLFGLEDRWGNLDDLLGGIYTKNILYTSLSGWNCDGTISSSYENAGTTIISGDGVMSAIAGNNKGMFIPVSFVSDSSYSTYYSGYSQGNGGGITCIAYGGGMYNYGTLAGVFSLGLNNTISRQYAGNVSRLMYLDGLA